MLKITLKQLELFAAVAETGSFTQAAEQCYVTQSTVSVHIATLENALGAPLLIRDNHRRVSLTPAGRDAYEYAREVLAGCYKMEQAVGQKNGEKIRIGASSVPSQCLLPGIMAGFTRKYPNHSFQLRRGDSTTVHDLLRSGEIRMGFAGSVLDRSSMDYTLLTEDTLVVVTPATDYYRALQAQGASGNRLLTDPIIVREENSGSRREFERYLNSCGIQPDQLNIVAEIDQPATILESVAQGVGISVISSMAAAQAVRSGRVLSFELEGGLRRGLYLVTLKGFAPGRAEKNFLDYLNEKK